MVEYLDSLVGHAGIQDTDIEDEAELQRISVFPTVRRQGVSRRLWDTAENFCRSGGYNRISLSTVDFMTPALAMYHSNGYSLAKVEQYGVPPNDQINIHHFVKELDPVT